jgi:hypothetical protein
MQTDQQEYDISPVAFERTDLFVAFVICICLAAIALASIPHS